MNVFEICSSATGKCEGGGKKGINIDAFVTVPEVSNYFHSEEVKE